ncbi:TnsD family Tn7-like transposition protein [Paenibacillus agricola]|uniref:Tn7-like transposition protein D n=1 Tax=Paenibacillus agricola TaxID=2716264 RepID=A0ABX0JA10_9BACL|nr:TnsD family Tn7-like transposition protein [Paenibacillus agricola]NHN31618.1 hypothetical protein [Paenibacillus agricola]
MLGSFPSLYPDEILYSGIARYHQRTAGKSFKDTVQDLFDGTLVCATVDLPSHLGKLSDKLAGGLDTETLINHHTLLPYYRPFLKQERYSLARSIMEVGACWGEVHAVIGLLASGVKNPSYLKFCSECYQEDDRIYGEPYWHRVHQLPGLLVCPHHHVFLTASNVRFNTNDQKQEFTVLSSIPDHNTTNLNFGSWDKQHLLYIAQQSLELLCSYIMPIDPELIRQKYLNRLGCLGCTSETNRFRMKHIILSYKATFSDNLLAMTGEMFDVNTKDTWLHRLLRKPEECCHPLRHLSVLCFLKEDVSLLTNSAPISPIKQENMIRELNSLQHSNEELALRRNRMLLTMSSCDGCSKKEIRMRNQKDFTWLYRHDLAWLMEVLPRSIKTHKQVYRINWKDRDTELVLLVTEAIADVLNADIPVRISSAAVGRHINRRNIIDKHLSKLPRTQAMLKSHIETTQHFQIRRLEWAFRRLLEEEDRVLGWRLLKKAGIPDQVSNTVLLKIQELLSGHDDLFIGKMNMKGNYHAGSELSKDTAIILPSNVS